MSGWASHIEPTRGTRHNEYTPEVAKRQQRRHVGSLRTEIQSRWLPV